MDGVPPASLAPPTSATDPPAYVYAADDNAPRSTREIELCKRASHFDWVYAGSFAVAVVASEYVNLQVLKSQEEPGVRLIGPGAIGFFWGGFLSGAYLSLPKCSPTFAYGAPPEGNIRADWPVAAAITLVSIVTAPAMDYIFLGVVPVHWTNLERSGRVVTAMITGAAGSLFPYLVPPRTWSAFKEIERIRVGTVAGGPYLSYSLTF